MHAFLIRPRLAIPMLHFLGMQVGHAATCFVDTEVELTSICLNCCTRIGGGGINVQIGRDRAFEK